MGRHGPPGLLMSFDVHHRARRCGAERRGARRCGANGAVGKGYREEIALGRERQRMGNGCGLLDAVCRLAGKGLPPSKRQKRRNNDDERADPQECSLSCKPRRHQCAVCACQITPVQPPACAAQSDPEQRSPASAPCPRGRRPVPRRYIRLSRRVGVCRYAPSSRRRRP